ncbi:MAG: hypothetical protein ACREA5_06230 [Nitrosotalea sp.]
MIYEKTNNFYNQKINISNVREWRFDFFAKKCLGKKVLHVGCADSMVYDPQSNLHIYLSKIDGNYEKYSEERPQSPTILHGLDIDVETTNKLIEACPGTYFISYSDVKEEYDIVLVPEVMEHVPDVSSFLKNIFSVSSKEYLITVPNMSVAQIFCDDEYALEMVHPDHKYWFSPYTLYKTISPFIPENFKSKMHYLENKTQIGFYLQKKTDWELQVEREEKEKLEQEKLAQEKLEEKEKEE